jgi:hypothetical protein
MLWAIQMTDLQLCLSQRFSLTPGMWEIERETLILTLRYTQVDKTHLARASESIVGQKISEGCLVDRDSSEGSRVGLTVVSLLARHTGLSQTLSEAGPTTVRMHAHFDTTPRGVWVFVMPFGKKGFILLRPIRPPVGDLCLLTTCFHYAAT